MAVVTQTIQDQVTELYLGFFGRAPDAAGFGYWTSEVAAGNVTPTQLAARFAATPEFVSEYNGLTPTQQINKIYNNVLNRAPDAAGGAYWVAELVKGTPIGTVVWQIVNAAFQQVGTADGLLVQNKVTVGEYFAISVGSNDTAQAKTAYNLVTSLPASVAQAESTLYKTAYTLTTDINTIEFNGSYNRVNATGTTFSAGDSITGNGYGVGNTLQVTDTTGASAAGVPAGVRVAGIQTATVNASGSIGAAAGGAVQGVTTVTVPNAGAANDTVTLNIGGVNTTYLVGANQGATATNASNAIIAAMGGLGIVVTTGIVGGVVTVTGPAAGTPLPTIVPVSATQGIELPAITVTTAGRAASAAAVYDVSGWTGLTALNVTSVGGENLNASTTAAVSASNTAQGANAVTINGGSSVTLTTTGQTTGTVGVTTTGAATVNNTVASGVGGAITVAGSSINVTETTSNAVNTTATQSAVTANGTAATTAVTINQRAAAVVGATVVGVVNGAVTVNDVNYNTALAQSINTVNLGSYGAATINSRALNTLNLSGTGTSVTTNLAGTSTLPGTTLNVNLNGLTQTGALTDASGLFTTLNLNTGATAGVANALGTTVVGTGLKTVNVAGSGNLTADLTTASVTAINAASLTGNITVNVNATTSTYAGGSGNDTVIIAAAPTKAINGGAGTADTLIVNFAGAFSPVANTNISGFEILGMGAAANGALNATGFSGLLVAANPAGASSFTNVAAGTGITFATANANQVTYTLANATGLSDSVAVALTSGTISNDLVATGVENINITVGANATAVANMNTLVLSAQATTGAVSNWTITTGALNGFTLTNTDTLIASVNASGVQGSTGAAGTGFVWTTGALAATTPATTTTITGSLNGGDVINAAAALDLVSITAFKGTNTLTGSTANKNTIVGGTGADTINGGNLADTITGGGGADIITAGTGADSITVSGNTARINQGSGASGTNTANTIQTSELTGTFDVITGLVAGDQFAVTSNANIVTGTLNLAAANLAAGANNSAVFARGTYNAAAGTFTYSANGTDTVVTYDTDAAGTTAFESVVLVGYVAGAGTTAAGGVITLA